MRKNIKIKLILLGIFLIIFGLLFWYFYQPSSEVKKENQKEYNSSFNLFPFGDVKKPIKEKTKPKQENNQTATKNQIKEKMPVLRQISNIPTAGINFTHLTKPELHKFNVEHEIFNTDRALKYDDHISEIRYVAQKNGHIYSTYTYTKKQHKSSIITIPKIYNAEFWDKNHLVIQYLSQNNDIKTYSIILKEKTDAELEEEAKSLPKGQKPNKNILNFSGRFLPKNIQEFSLLPNSNKIFFIKKDLDTGKTVGIISKNLGEDKKQIWESRLHEWNVNWKNPKNILINSKASKKTYTLSFKLNSQNGDFEKVGEVLLAGNGLPNYSFTKILYSGKDYNNQFHLYVYDIKTQELKKINGIATLVEKCVWSKNNIDVYCGVPDNGVSSEEPDDWYKGYTDFSDSIYRIDTDNLSTTLVFNSYEYNKHFDISKIYLDYFEDYIYFIDGMTNFAWSYKIPDDLKPKNKNINYSDEKFTGKLGGGNVCPKELTLTENLRAGDRDGKYSSWAKKKITEVKILQRQMNRLGFNAGKVDGILGKNSDAAIRRMQKYLGTKQDGLVGPITRELLNNSCE